MISNLALKAARGGKSCSILTIGPCISPVLLLRKRPGSATWAWEFLQAQTNPQTLKCMETVTSWVGLPGNFRDLKHRIILFYRNILYESLNLPLDLQDQLPSLRVALCSFVGATQMCRVTTPSLRLILKAICLLPSHSWFRHARTQTPPCPLIELCQDQKLQCQMPERCYT